jgi:hypothetical protein
MKDKTQQINVKQKCVLKKLATQFIVMKNEIFAIKFLFVKLFASQIKPLIIGESHSVSITVVYIQKTSLFYLIPMYNCTWTPRSQVEVRGKKPGRDFSDEKPNQLAIGCYGTL